jgi:hypothetical protein
MAAPLSTSPPDRSWAVLVVIMPGEGAPPVSGPSVESSLEDEESLEVFVAPSSREVCHVCPMDVYEVLLDERFRAYMLYCAGEYARPGRAPLTLLRPRPPTQALVSTMIFILFTY